MPRINGLGPTSFQPGNVTMRLAHHLFIVVNFILIIACAAATHYAITIQYIPQKALAPSIRMPRDFRITVTTFNDFRPVADRTVIGKKITAKNDTTPVLVTTDDPAHSVSLALKDFLTKSGYDVGEIMPVWDLSEQSITRSWGQLVIGGTIEELEIICRSESPGADYQSRVKLRVALGDVQRKKILHATTIESNATLKHLHCSEKTFQEQLNAALSLALEKIMEHGELDTIIQEITAIRSESLHE